MSDWGKWGNADLVQDMIEALTSFCARSIWAPLGPQQGKKKQWWAVAKHRASSEGNCSVPGNENRRVFTYQTRVSVRPEQDTMLREYAARFGRVERTLYREMQKGADANRLKSDYLVPNLIV